MEVWRSQVIPDAISDANREQLKVKGIRKSGCGGKWVCTIPQERNQLINSLSHSQGEQPDKRLTDSNGRLGNSSVNSCTNCSLCAQSRWRRSSQQHRRLLSLSLPHFTCSPVAPQLCSCAALPLQRLHEQHAVCMLLACLRSGARARRAGRCRESA